MRFLAPAARFASYLSPLSVRSLPSRKPGSTATPGSRPSSTSRGRRKPNSSHKPTQANPYSGSLPTRIDVKRAKVAQGTTGPKLLPMVAGVSAATALACGTGVWLSALYFHRKTVARFRSEMEHDFEQWEAALENSEVSRSRKRIIAMYDRNEKEAKELVRRLLREEMAQKEKETAKATPVFKKEEEKYGEKD
ncbi:hypothetical protein JCM10213_008345 [Rhodosporidiobolus nylandii]